MSYGVGLRNGVAFALGTIPSLTSGGGLRPSLLLNFLSGTLDSRITFSRGTQATQYTSNGTLQYAPNNLLTYSNQADNAAWTKSNSFVQTNLLQYSNAFTTAPWNVRGTATATANAITSPDGTNNGWLIAGIGVLLNDVFQQITVASGVSYTPSFWIKRVSTTGTFKSFLNGNGNVVCVYSNSGDTNTQASIFKLTGTTEAVSTVIVGNLFGSITTTLDLIAVTASKTLCVYANTGSLVWYANILTDTSGTASVGTEISNSYSGTFNNIQGVYASGNSVRIGINTSTLSQQHVLDCSGTSPVRSAVQSVAVSTSSPSSTASFIASTLLCVRQPQMLYAGETLYIQSSSTSLLFDLLLTANGIGRQPSAGRSLTYTTVGANNNESWGVAAVVGATTGIVINRIEAAA